jgi:hypothetical protein
MRHVTFTRADSPMDDFSEGSRIDGRVYDQSTVAFNGVALILLDGRAIAAGFGPKPRGQSGFAAQLSGWARCDGSHFPIVLSGLVLLLFSQIDDHRMGRYLVSKEDELLCSEGLVAKCLSHS